jgi:hypothetical protein
MRESQLFTSPPFISNYPTSASDLAAQLAATRAELATLQKRYDALHADRDRLVQTLETNLKKYKRFREWLEDKKPVPSKAAHVADPEVKCASDSTPALQQHPAVKMLETPETPMSLSFLYSLMGYLCQLDIQNFA